jgi:hypothetical protein
MNWVMLIIAVGMPMLLAAGFLLGRHFQRRQYAGDPLSPVSRQHIDLFQGGQLSETLVEAAKSRFRDLLERGQPALVEASMRPGMAYVVQVRALTELGTEEAGRILERQLQRRLTDDIIEQSWYWIDLANGLRMLNREESLPHLLRCSDGAGDIPLGHFFAAETVCFLGFSGYLRQSQTPLGRSALRVLHRALEGLRFGVPPQMVPEARLGELIEGLWDNRPERVDPLVVRIAVEALRQIRRAPHMRVAMRDDGPDKEAFDWQLSRLAVLEPVLSDYLSEAPHELCAALATSRGQLQRDTLTALADLRAEAGSTVMALLSRPGSPNQELAIEVLTWSRDPRVGPWLREWTRRRVPMLRRSQRRKRPLPPRQPSLPADVPYRAVLRALRGHASEESEVFLLLAAQDWDPTFRAAAVSSLAWWEPVRRAQVLDDLQQARRDGSPDVRQAARAALARLGERLALQWFRQALNAQEAPQVHETIQVIAMEGLTMLWPDLDRLADSEDSDIAQLAREALERMCEDMGVWRNKAN